MSSLCTADTVVKFWADRLSITSDGFVQVQVLPTFV